MITPRALFALTLAIATGSPAGAHAHHAAATATTTATATATATTTTQPEDVAQILVDAAEDARSRGDYGGCARLWLAEMQHSAVKQPPVELNVRAFMLNYALECYLHAADPANEANEMQRLAHLQMAKSAADRFKKMAESERAGPWTHSEETKRLLAQIDAAYKPPTCETPPPCPEKMCPTCPPVETADESARSLRKAGFGLMVGGGVLLIPAIVGTAIALDYARAREWAIDDALEKNATEIELAEIKDRNEWRKHTGTTIAVFSTVGAAALITTGAILQLVGRRRDPKFAGLSPVPLNHGAGVVWSARF